MKININYARALAGVVAVAAAALVYTYTTPKPILDVSTSMDATASVGTAWTNDFVPLTARMLPLLIGKNISVVRFGGEQRETLFAGTLTDGAARTLSAKILNLTLYGREVAGSPITREGVAACNWLRTQNHPPSEQVMIIETDGEEDGLVGQAARIDRSAVEGMTVLVISPRPHTRVGEVLASAGARVQHVEPDKAYTAIEQAMWRSTPLTRARPVAWIAALAGLLLLATSVRRRGNAADIGPSSTVVTLPQPAPTPRLEFTAQPVNVNVTCGGYRELSVSKALIPGRGTISIASQNASNAATFDLLLPDYATGPTGGIALAISLIDDRYARVQNNGRSVMIAGSGPLQPGESTRIALGDSVQVAPTCRFTIDRNPEEVNDDADLFENTLSSGSDIL